MTLRIRRALLSVYDKVGLVDFARELSFAGVELISTGGTAAALRAAGLAVKDVASVTGEPEMLGGRVKTLHPRIHGGLLARRDSTEHMATLDAHGIEPIDLLVSNLYPFEATAAEGGITDTIEMIDVGGPTLIRAAAKNHESVTVVVDPEDYPLIIAELHHGGRIHDELRERLAAKAFAVTAGYDAAIARWFARRLETPLPLRFALAGQLLQRTRYGENPHQAGAFYATGEPRPGVASAQQVQGKALSFNNIADADAALELAAEFDEPAVVIIKHANPCGVAIGPDLADAHARALACDPQSAYGGIVALNRPVDAAAAEAITRVFTEVVIAPEADDGALAVFEARPNLRVLLTGTLPDAAAPGLDIRSVAGGLLVQDRDRLRPADHQLTPVTARKPTEAETRDLRFAFTVCKHVRSNAIVLARDGATVGIGAGQMSRVDAVRIAVQKATEAAREAGEGELRTRDSVVASDAFFPFPDGLQAALEAGATAAIQPGGSLRDEEVIAAADRAGAAMVFTGARHFRH
jgi:phosphoribosylaminoimidazolecarboxamide formyltransferase/IMP cyclohydrolase